MGAMPDMSGLSAEGQKNLAEAFTKETCVAPPKAPKKAKVSKPEDTVEMVPKTIMEQAMDKSDDVLKAATEARKFALHLQHVNYSGELVQGLMGFSTRMESHFKQLKELKAKQESNPHVYEKVLQGICREEEWYKQAEAGGRSTHFGFWGPSFKLLDY